GRLAGDDRPDRPGTRRGPRGAVGRAVRRAECDDEQARGSEGRDEREANHQASHYVPPRLTEKLGGLGEPVAREGPEALPGLVVRPERLVAGVLRIGGDLLGHRPDLPGEGGVMLGVPQERLDPALRAVVRRKIVVEEQLPEREAATDVGERPERENAMRRLDEL